MILTLATGPLAQAVGWALLNLVWQGAAIAAVLALLLGLLPSRSANVRYALSCAALVLVVVLGVATGVRSYPADPAAHAQPTRLTPLRAALARSLAMLPRMEQGTASPGASRAEQGTASPATSNVAPLSAATIVVATFAPARAGRLPDPLRAATDALPAIVTLWLAGVTLLSLRLLFQWLHARRLVTHDAQPACEPWLAMAHRLSRALGVRHAVRLLESTVVQVPAVIGLLRPVILLPANTLSGLLPGQLEMILAHELAHIRRHDFLVNLLQAVVETLLFYHPAVWWISRQVRIERENCCDDLAVRVCGNPIQYARALTRLEELRAAVLPLALSARGGSLVDRIRRVVSGPERSIAPVRGVVALAAFACVVLALATPSLSAIAKPQPATSAKSSNSSKSSRLVIRSGKSDTAKPKPAPVDLAAPDEHQVEAVTADLRDDRDDAGQGVDDRQNSEVDPNSNAAIARGRLQLTVDELIQLRSQGVTTSGILEMRFLFPRIAIPDIAGMYAVGATPEYVRRMRAAGLDVDSPSEAQSLAAVGVTPEFLSGIRAAGLEVESANAATGLAAVGVTPEFVRDIRAAGLKITSANDAQALAAVGVTPEFIREMRDNGFKVETAAEAQGLAAVGVTADYIRDIRATGFRLETPAEAQGMAAVGVTPEYIREIRATGFKLESPEEAQGLAAVGVTPEYIRKMRATGFRLDSPRVAQGLAAVGVTPEYVREMREAGLKIESANEVQSLAALGVTSEWLDGMRDAGVSIRTADDAQSLRALGVTPKFVRKLAKAGFVNLSVNDLQRLAAGGLSDSFLEEMSQYRNH